MRQEVFFTLVLIFAVAAQTISAENRKREIFKRQLALPAILQPLLPIICPLISKIPTIGPIIFPIIDSLIGCSSSGGVMPTNPSMSSTMMMPATTMAPGMNPTTMMPTTMMPTTMMPSMNPIMMTPSMNPTTMTPGMNPTTMTPTMNPTTMTPGKAPTPKPLISSIPFLNPLVCPILSIVNSVPIAGPVLVNSINPLFFRCVIPPTGGSS